jgi:hypothetical protein
MMKFLKSLALTLLASAAFAHEGHGVAGSVGHDLQHQLWNFAGLIVLGVLVLGGDHIVALVVRSRKDKEDRDR